MSKITGHLNKISGIEIKLTKTPLAFVNKLPIYLSKAFSCSAAEIEAFEPLIKTSFGKIRRNALSHNKKAKKILFPFLIFVFVALLTV